MKSLLFVFCVLFVYTWAETNIHFNFDGMIPPLPVCGCGSVCGDGICAADEDIDSCPNDCNIIQPVCGDDSCDTGHGEDPFTCPQDCSRCGDGVCDNTESLVSCPSDCTACGDGVCSATETVTTCPADCSNICGNGRCESGENFQTCPRDCPCTPTCSGKNCGSDGCGGSCGTCPTGQTCGSNGLCSCLPNCSGRQCGSDGCGGSCGTCPTGQSCGSNGVCSCAPNCVGRNCGNDGCGGSCGTCPTGQTCSANGLCSCVPSCSGRNCGNDGCGGTCGTCPTGQTCGSNGLCSCVPSCSGRQCGNDGCGGSCGTCPTGQTCGSNGLCSCVPNCSGRQCGTDGCGGSCGTCPTGQICESGACRVDSGSGTVTFTIYQASSGTAGFASGVTVTSSSGSGVTNASGSVSLLVPLGGTVTISGSGYHTVTITIASGTTSQRLLIPPVLNSGDVFVAALWADPDYDFDLHMFGPGNSTFYPGDYGAVNWKWEDKSEESPYAEWDEVSGSGVGAEVIYITRMNTTAIYDFMMFNWWRVGQNDPESTFQAVSAELFLYGGSATGIGSYAFMAIPPTPPSGTDWVYYSPFRLNPTGTGHTVEVKTNSVAFNPAVSLSDIDATNVAYPCSYSYCPYDDLI